MTFLKTLVARMAALLALAMSVAVCATPGQPGTIDTTFNGTGQVVTHITGAANLANAAALQPDGKIVLGGICQTGGFTNLCAVRYNIDGSLDTSFGGTGKIVSIVAASDNVTSVAVQRDGKLLFAGSCQRSVGIGFCARRFNADGSPDTAYGDGVTGTALTMMGSSSSTAGAIVLQPDNKLVLAGSCFGGPNQDFCALRLNTDGSPDASFGTGGKAITAISTQGLGTDSVRAVALQPDGKVVLAGQCSGGQTQSLNDLCALRYNANGALDLTFNGTGWLKVHLGNATFASGAVGVVVQPDGKLVLFGSCDQPTSFCTLRLNANGTPDLGFSGTGTVIIRPIDANVSAKALAAQPDNKLLLAGKCPTPFITCPQGICSTFDMCVLRVHTDGTRDNTFNGNGLVSTTIGVGAGADVNAILLQPDGKIVLAGNCANATDADFCAVRYDGGPFAQPSCNLDIDGDGQILSTVDSLIHARIALGMSGNSVTNGIVFPGAAKRTSWALIRTHLNTWCGMSLPQ